MNQFDRHIRSQIYDLETDVPVDMWSNIAAEIAPKKNRRPLIFWILAAGIGSLALFYSQSRLAVPDRGVSQDLEVQKSAQSASLHLDKSNRESSDQKPTTYLTMQHSPTTIADEASTLNKSGLSSSERIKLEVISESLTPIYPNNTHAEVARDQDSADESSLPLSEASKSSINYSSSEKIASRSFVVVQPLAQLDLEPKIQACPPFGAAGTLRPFVEFGAQAGYPLRSMDLKDPELGTYRDIRSDAERIKMLVAAEAMVGLRYRERVEVKVGLGLRRLHEVFDFNDPNASRTITSIITDTVYNNGIPIIRTDTSVITEYGQRIKLSQNHYTFLDIPILAGYGFAVKQHRFWVHAGVAMNLKFWQKGDLLAPDQEIVSITSSDPNRHPVFKDQAGLDLLGSISYEIGINPHQVVHLRANFRYPLQDLTLDNYPIDQRYKQVSFGLAWKHNF